MYLEIYYVTKGCKHVMHLTVPLPVCIKWI